MEDKMLRNDIVNVDKKSQSQMVVHTHGTPASLLDIRKNPEQFPRLHTYYQLNKDTQIYEFTNEAKGRMAQIVLKAHMYRGITAEKNNVTFIAVSLLEELIADNENLGMKVLTFDEIERAIKQAVLGQGREVYGISVGSLYAIIADYCRNEGHRVCQELGKLRRKEMDDKWQYLAFTSPMMQERIKEMLKKK